VIWAGANKGRLKGYILHPPTANRLKSFCEVDYVNCRPNVLATSKRISMEILVGWGCMYDA